MQEMACYKSSFDIDLKVNEFETGLTKYRGSVSLHEISLSSFLPISEKYLLNSLAIFLSPTILPSLVLISLIVVVLDFLFSSSLIVCQLSLILPLLANLEV